MHSKQEKIANFNPSDVGQLGNNIFGLPFTEEESDIILFPVPWEVTTSYASGTAKGPDAIMEASYQVDLYDLDFPDTWKKGIYMLDNPAHWNDSSFSNRLKAKNVIEHLSEGGEPENNPRIVEALHDVNNASIQLNQWVYEETSRWLKQGKKVGLVGGDHSTPLGYMKALGEQYGSFGILQIDAHADLRNAYEGFTYSHASIMFNALQLPAVEKLVQVGIRDICEEEVNYINTHAEKVATFYDQAIKRRQFEGATWKSICEDIIAQLPKNVYISFDIDGLDPKLCPSTGTPVPGGFELEQINYLLVLLKQSGKHIIGFDLNEVAPGESEMDAIVGARVLFKLCGVL
ncbi:MAG: agmatinase family protein [Chitinophagales bacterium]|nr:agmatinase family protein [Chitinophagales bacterium]